MSKKRKVFDVQLDKEEQEMLESVEAGEWKTVDNLEEEIAKARAAARNFLKKDTRVNIRISSSDLDRLKRMAAYEGLPYQTLMASILHKYAAGHLEADSR